MFLAVIHGFLLAIGLIMPLGVQNVFVFNQGVYHAKWRNALPVVITSSLCDNMLILTAVSGVSVVVLKVAWVKYLIGAVGALFLLYMAYATWNSEDSAVEDGNARKEDRWPLKKQILFTMTVSLLNPHAIIDTIGVIGTSSLAYIELKEKVAFTGTTMAVSWLWFIFLMSAGHLLGKTEKRAAIQKVVNRGSAIIMLISAAILIKMLFS